MTTFNTCDYQFLCKCLSEGSLVFKAQSIKRLTSLTLSDKKQFLSNSKQVLTSIQPLITQEKEDINLLATLLLSQIISTMVSKDNEYHIRNKHLPYVVQNLGHSNKPNVRKASHTCLLSFIKAYHNFDNLVWVYLGAGFNHDNYLVRQKSINSFQSILILEMKHFNWQSQQSKNILENLISKINDDNPYISKASTQCILSMFKIEGIKNLVKNLTLANLLKIKNFIEDTMSRIPSTQSLIQTQYIDEIINGMKRVNVLDKIDPPNQNQQEIEEKQHKLTHNEVHLRRLEKIKKSIANTLEDKKTQPNQQLFLGKMFGAIHNDGSLKQRTQAAEQLLYRIQINKNKPEFQASIKAILPNIIKMIKDPNPKIVGVSLKILDNIMQEIKHSDTYLLNNLISVIVEKLGDQKISIRQMVSKVIKELIRKTDKSQWIKQLIENLRKNTNTFLKDQSLTIIQYIFEDSSIEDISYNHMLLLQQIVPFTQDPKTKIKIRTLDCMAMIAFKSSIEDTNNFLKNKMSEVFYQMYTEKVAKLIAENQRKVMHDVEKNKKRNQQENNYKTTYNEKGNHRDSLRNDESEQLNLSIDGANRRAGYLLKHPRKILSTQQTASLDNTQRTIDRTIENVQMMLPSLYKKTKTNRFNFKKIQLSPTKTIDAKNSDYLCKEDLKPLRQPEKQLKTLLTDLKSLDWKVQFETINKLRRLCEFNPQLILTSSSTNIHMIVLDLLSLIESLRSSVSKNALICLNELILVMNRQIDPQMEIILQKLIKKSADTNAFISSQVQKCLNTLSVHATQPKFLQKILIFKDSKNFAIKEACLNTLLFMKEDERVRQKQFAKLTQNFAYFLNEAQQQLRNKAKVGILDICKSLGDWYRILRGKINPSLFKLVCQLMTKTSSNSFQIMNSIQQPKIKLKQTNNNNIQINKIVAKRQERSRSKIVKVAQFPPQFNQIQSYIDDSNSSDWKKRMQSLNSIKKLALNFPNQFCQFRSSSHFLDIMSKQILQPNLKVSVNAMQIFLQIIEQLKGIIENNVSVISSSIFNALSSNKIQIKQCAQKCTEQLIKNIQISTFLQHMCHGIMYSLPKSRIFLVNRLNDLIQQIFNEKKQLLFKYVFPTLNKLMEEYKAELMPHVVNLFSNLYEIMGNNMFSHLAKFKEVRQLIAK